MRMKLNRRDFIKQAIALSSLPYCRALAADVSDKTKEWNAILTGHKLQSLEVLSVQMKWPRLVGKNARLDVHGRGPREAVCRITTDKGATGWGQFLSRPQNAAEVLSAMRGMPISHLFDPSIGILKPEAKPLDFALHDLAGIILDVPVYEMLGHDGPDANLCYSGMIYFDDLEPPENPAGIDKVIQNCWYDLEYGYRQLKVKIGRGSRWMEKNAGITRDVEVTRKIAAIFPGVDILVDANDGYSCEDLIEYLERIGQIDLFWIEEPFKENREDYQILRSWLHQHNKKTLLADGEASPDYEFIMALLKEKLIDVNLYDICGYGFTAWRALMPILKAINATSSPHAFGSRLKTNYTAHLATGLGNVVTIEGITCASEEIDFGNYTLKNGKLITPPTPGFGMMLKV